MNPVEDNSKAEESWEESEESDDFSLGISGGPCFLLQEGESSKDNTQIKLMQCSEENLSEANLAAFAKATNPMKTQTPISEFLDEGGNAEVKTTDQHETDNKEADGTKKKLAEVKGTTIEERRISARLQKDIMLTIEDKTKIMSKKRNLEGTNLTSQNSFSILEDCEIIQLSKNMGIDLGDSNFAAIDLIKDLEIARHCLADKTLVSEISILTDEAIIEEVEEELSDYENLIIQTPKRKSKPKNRLSLSGPKKKKKSKENLCSKPAKEDQQGTHAPLLAEKKNKGKKKS